MQRTGQRDTAAELALRKALFKLGLRYRVNAKPILGLTRSADVVFAGAKVAVYVDGCFWHGCPIHATWPKANAEFWRNKIETNRRRDADTDERLAQQGWLVIRAWEHEDPAVVAESVASTVRERMSINARNLRTGK